MAGSGTPLFVPHIKISPLMLNYKIFSNAQFGEIRVRTGSVPLFCLVDLCRAMGFYNPSSVKKLFKASDVVMLRCKTSGTQRAKRNMNFVTEKAVTWLINKESNRDLTSFREWMNTEVIPQSKTEEKGEQLAEPDDVMAIIEATAIRLEKLTKRLDILEKMYKKHSAPLPTIVADETPRTTVAEFVVENKLPVERKEYSYFSVVARSVCRIKGIDDSVEVRNGTIVKTYPVDVLVQVFKDYGLS